MEMPIYTVSSTDPDHYNRLHVNLPTDQLPSFVNVCVTSLTCNYNIEIMSEKDYITYNIDGVPYTVNMKTYSKMSLSDLPYILQDIHDEQNVPITIALTNLDTLKFVCDKVFRIMDMSYGMRLLTGFYCTKLPIQALSYKDTISITEKTNKDVTAVALMDLALKAGDTRPIEVIVSPPDAYGYNIQWTSADEDILAVSGAPPYGVAPEGSAGNVTCVNDISETKTVKITGELRNHATSLLSPADFIMECTVTVFPRERVEITSVEVVDAVSLFPGDAYTIYPKITPVSAAYYTENYISATPEIASLTGNVITANAIGETVITYEIVNVLDDGTQQQFSKEITVKVISPTMNVEKFAITSESVGYCLSTPILYLLTNIGSSVYFNEIDNEQKMQSGTIAMVLNNSYSSSFPIVAQQADIVTRCHVGCITNFWLYLVDANMREVKLLNPMYITVQVVPDPTMNGVALMG